MGISGLLPVLKPIQRQIHLSALSGLVVGVDAYVWLHRGAFGCACKYSKLSFLVDLLNDIPTKKYSNQFFKIRYVNFCMKKVMQLKEFGVWPIIVFDGGISIDLLLNDRFFTNEEEYRKSKKIERRQKALQYLKEGNQAKALEYCQTCIDVTPEMAHEWIKELQKHNIEYIVAPYEADAQLAYLNRNGIISAVITEDSDLLTFGCTRVIYKLDKDGNGIEIRKQDIGNIRELQFWDETKFRQMCILSGMRMSHLIIFGCDYLESPKGIGVKTAIKLLSNTDAYTLIKSWMNFGKLVNAPVLKPGYLKEFEMADLTFKHQFVYDSHKSQLVHLQPISDIIDIDIHLCSGSIIESSIAQQIALGNYNPITKLPFLNTVNENKNIRHVDIQNHSTTKKSSSHIPSLTDKTNRDYLVHSQQETWKKNTTSNYMVPIKTSTKKNQTTCKKLIKQGFIKLLSKSTKLFSSSSISHPIREQFKESISVQQHRKTDCITAIDSVDTIERVVVNDTVQSQRVISNYFGSSINSNKKNRFKITKK
ncbi:Rad2 nuclease [Globomyces sp. JEL0801]|nr:Rad2 nuclease [Globomyces sp. JEL0801]